MTVVSSEFESAEIWQQWQWRNAESGRKANRQIRAIFAVVFVAICTMLAYQLLSR